MAYIINSVVKSSNKIECTITTEHFCNNEVLENCKNYTYFSEVLSSSLQSYVDISL